MLLDRCPDGPVLSVCNIGVLWPNGWMDQDATWYRGRPWPRHRVRWRPSCPMERGPAVPPLSRFMAASLGPNKMWPMSTVAKWLD